MLAHDAQLSLPQRESESEDENESEDDVGPTVTQNEQTTGDQPRDRNHPVRDHVPPKFYGDLVVY